MKTLLVVIGIVVIASLAVGALMIAVVGLYHPVPQRDVVSQEQLKITVDALDVRNDELNDYLDRISNVQMGMNRQVGIAYNASVTSVNSLQYVWDTLYCENFLEIPFYLENVYTSGDDSRCAHHDEYMKGLEDLFREE